jgi:hypothetical protein
MPSKRSVEGQLAALEGLREDSPEAALEPLRRLLAHRNNYVVAKTADLVTKFRLTVLIPELLAALDRFFNDPLETDPQCWAKNSLARTLAALECQDAAIFLRGMRHTQFEPVWGGRSDTAGGLRGTCALALVQCRTLPEADLLAHLIELLSDKDKTVRGEVVRAIEQVGSPAAALLLRLRAVLGADEPEVLGGCYSGILAIEGMTAIPWVARFLAGADDSAAEAAMAIASTRSPEAFEALRTRFLDKSDPWFRSVLLAAIALTRQEAALEFLLDLVRKESPEAEAAAQAIVRAMPSPEVLKQLEEMALDNPRLACILAKHRAARL